MTLESDIHELHRRYENDDLDADSAGSDERDTLDAFLEALERGEVRAAEKRDGTWEAISWVKEGILLNFALRDIQPRRYGDVTYHDVLPLRENDDLLAKGTRNTPDGTVVRRGAYIGEDAILMSPSFVNIGAYVGDGTLVDSSDTIGSAAQIGSDVKLGANLVLGGVLEPIENAPVVIEDGVALGAGVRVTSGFVVGENSIVGENTLLTPRIPIYDLVEEEVIYGHLPPERRAFTRFVESSMGEHDLFEGGAYKPAVVATDLEASTLENAQREEVLRS
ncbi:2,3,4,5-tetrahydropyridine-2,6-dicarboxylate N-succinyltransferase [Halanaeroarchaeum sulfurireducens]|uniref:2,3,4,5-tetrahydropyridine-2,6-carboxylate N-succinyltransferase n=1 Tax=Halanaeroarchaeum sulfurireducens TaxID=1604004 RepID=A0A0F7P8Z0_9EURY|nr:2,3,4,5-tetrahydropyridine-2,6-dicarboxylate N-succinyltransferase [Halanaeroarchaeum sulfurireducens]AKH97212.1 2,3,4,5-tetrahydropyridine-2,6-carboxylate N-succinyltransferase [Halanaeroarchaeum sulfurireducens]ALG81614.1 2,3,4,5-tetrahydropyridine-2,6-carboxylate N-succinyltransferase [Halanaeroarchaeum sulfurireducens]